MDSAGYPIVASTGKMFGFEKIGLKVRNITAPIVESGTGDVVFQDAAGKTVAVARHHRNAC
jgi:hypothetical protein